ncbi:MAG: hypothetical protein H0W08_15630, partial [Acidobacteria bacterium]|nr:hypothetical protein [Acidobacteriota bacterium]
MHKMLAGGALSIFLLGTAMVGVTAAQPRAAAGPGRPAKPCNPRKQTCPDTTPPSIAIGAPAADAVVNGTVTVTGTASDNVGVTLVEVQVDDSAFQAATGTSNWTFSVDSTAYPDGGHRIRARATDASGNVSAAASRSVTFTNSPSGNPDVLAILNVRVDRPTLHALGVQVLISGDDNRSGRIDVRHRRAGDTAWVQGLPLLRVMPETIIESVPQQFAGSIFDLDPGTPYEIELHATDLDGAVDVTYQAIATTREVPVTDPVNARTIQVSNAAALRTALNAAQAGDVILLAPGTY